MKPHLFKKYGVKLLTAQRNGIKSTQKMAGFTGEVDLIWVGFGQMKQKSKRSLQAMRSA